MPSGGLKPCDEETARLVAGIFRNSVGKYGLMIEWFQFFIGGVLAGVDPVEAAHLAAIEWDM